MNFSEFADQYFDQYRQISAKIDRGSLEKFKNLVVETYKNGKRFYTAGNGGSAAIAEHFLCDLSKGTYFEEKNHFRSSCFAANGPLLTAIGNDWSYDQVFSKQVEMNVEKGDLVLLISSSGNSPNVVKACEVAQARGAKVAALVGFEGGKLKDMADVAVWAPLKNYGVVEDLHQSVMHILTQYLTLELKEGRL